MATDRKEISAFDLFRLESSDNDSVSITQTIGDDIPDYDNTEEEEEQDTDIPEKDEEEIEEELEEEQEEEEEVQHQEEVEESSEDDDEGVYSTIANVLIEDEILSPLEGKDYDDTEEGFKELFEDSLVARIEEYKNSIPEEVRDFISYIENGGDPSEYINKASEVKYNEVDVDDEDNQKLLVREHLEAQGLDEEEVEDLLTEYEDMNTLGKHAKVAQKVLSKKQEAEHKEFIQRQEEYKKERELYIQQQEEEFKQAVFSKEELAGLKLTKKEKEQFYNYLTKPVKRDEKGDLLTQNQVDSLSIDTRLELAFYQFKGGVKEIEKKIDRKKTLKLKEKLSHYQDKNINSSTESMDKESGQSTKKQTQFKLPYSFM